LKRLESGEGHQRVVWQRRPGQLDQTEVHLWSLSLDASPAKLRRLAAILSPDEKERAKRFRRKGDGERYTIARGTLRLLLGLHLTVEPERLRFSYSPLGKPELAGEDAQSGLSFSVSHSGDQALLALARRRRIGVDLERVCSGVNVLELAERFFSPNEFKILRSLPPGIQREAFYCGWTRKEAYLKARGEGISSGLDSVEVSLIPGERAIIKKVSDDPNVSENWILEHLLPAPNYIGAVATEGHNLTFRFFRWEPD
jgi:4'-phosphopantetheinyl transferase